MTDTKQSETTEVICHRFSEEGWTRTSANVPSEMQLTIYVNEKELVTILCTPFKLNCLVLGFLYAEGFISGLKDVVTMRICEDDSLADVRLANPETHFSGKRTLPTGCGGGAVFKTDVQEIDSDLHVMPEEILSLMKQFQESMELYRISGGVHTSALADKKNLIIVAEDIGRHNTLDKIQGECLLTGISTQDRLLLTTGRISSEMLVKAGKMGIPVVITRRSPTSGAISLAHNLGITLVGHARGNRLTVYSHPERFGIAQSVFRDTGVF